MARHIPVRAPEHRVSSERYLSRMPLVVFTPQSPRGARFGYHVPGGRRYVVRMQRCGRAQYTVAAQPGCVLVGRDAGGDFYVAFSMDGMLAVIRPEVWGLVRKRLQAGWKVLSTTGAAGEHTLLMEKESQQEEIKQGVTPIDPIISRLNVVDFSTTQVHAA